MRLSVRFLLISIVLVTARSSAQTAFTMSWPLWVNLMYNNLEQTNDGGYIICADEAAAMDTLTNLNWCYLIKVNPNGSTQWTKRFVKSDAAAKADDGNSICETYNGGFAIATSMYTHTPTVWNSHSAIYVVRTTAGGNLLWSYTYPGIGNSSAFSIIETADHGFMICGSTIDTIVAQTNCYLLRLDSTGSVVWGKSYYFSGMGFNSRFTSVKETSDGGFIVSGHLNAGSILMKTDAMGNPAWSSSMPGSYSYENDVEEIPGGGFITCGNRTNYWGGFVNRYDSGGNIVWSKSYPHPVGSSTSGYDESFAVEVVSDGYTVGISNDNPSCVILMHLDTSGQIAWRKTYSTSHDYRPVDLVHTTDNGYAFTSSTITGPFSTNITLTKVDSLGAAYCSDTLIPDSIGIVPFQPVSVAPLIDTATPRLNQLTSIVPITLQPIDLCHEWPLGVPPIPQPLTFTAYPNPADNGLIMEWPTDQQPVCVTIFNLLGQPVVLHPLSRQNSSSELYIDTSQLPDGMYLVQLESEKGVRITERILVHH